MFSTDTWTKPVRTTMLTVNLPDGRKARGELLEVFTRHMRGGLCVQFYVKYDDGRNGMRTRIVDPVSMTRWRPRVPCEHTMPRANYAPVSP